MRCWSYCLSRAPAAGGGSHCAFVFCRFCRLRLKRSISSGYTFSQDEHIFTLEEMTGACTYPYKCIYLSLAPSNILQSLHLHNRSFRYQLSQPSVLVDDSQVVFHLFSGHRALCVTNTLSLMCTICHASPRTVGSSKIE